MASIFANKIEINILAYMYFVYNKYNGQVRSDVCKHQKGIL